MDLIPTKKNQVPNRQNAVKISTAKHLFPRILWTMAGISILLVILAHLWPTPLDLPADPNITPQQIKAAWFLLWIQELTSYSKKMIYLAALLFTGFTLLPFISRPTTTASWFAPGHRFISWMTLLFFIIILSLTFLAMFFRGPNWQLIIPHISRSSGNKERQIQQTHNPTYLKQIRSPTNMAIGYSLQANKQYLQSQKNHCLNCHPFHYQNQCTNCHRGNPKTSRKELAHYLLIPANYANFKLNVRGKKLIQVLGCRRCHLIFGQGNQIGPDLDKRIWHLPVKRIKNVLSCPSQIGQNIVMPCFNLPPGRKKSLISALLQTIPPDRQKSNPYRIFFDQDKGQDTPFARLCSPCHSLLSQPGGQIGPNLTNIFSRNFPSHVLTQTWTREKLRSWLQNPRQIYIWSTMPPVTILKQDLQPLYNELAR